MATVVNERDALLQGASSRTVLVDLPANVVVPSTRGVKLYSSTSTVKVDAAGANPAPATLTLQASLTGFPAGTVSNWSVTAGTLTLTGTGDTRTVSTNSFTTSSATVQVSVTYAGNTYIDRVILAKVSDGVAGNPGTRGSQDVARAVTGTAWSDSEALAALVASLGASAVPIVNDTCTLFNISAGFSEMRRYNGSAWVAVAQSLPGSVIMPGTITTEKLLVTGLGIALNSDPNTQDVTAWVGQGLTIASDSSAPTGGTVLTLSSQASPALSKRFPIDPSKNYRARTWAKQPSGNATAYLLVAFYDASGALIASTGTAGWLGITSGNCYFGLAGTPMPNAWTAYSVDFGPDESAKIPTGARYASLGILPNVSGLSGQRLAGYVCHLKTTGDMLVDGTVTAGKINGNELVIRDALGAPILGVNHPIDFNTYVGGVGKPANNATVGAEIGVNLSGQITGSNVSTFIANAAIGTAQVAELHASVITAGTITADKILAGEVTAVNDSSTTSSYTAFAGGNTITKTLALGAFTSTGAPVLISTLLKLSGSCITGALSVDQIVTQVAWKLDGSTIDTYTDSRRVCLWSIGWVSDCVMTLTKLLRPASGAHTLTAVVTIRTYDAVHTATASNGGIDIQASSVFQENKV